MKDLSTHNLWLPIPRVAVISIWVVVAVWVVIVDIWVIIVIIWVIIAVGWVCVPAIVIARIPITVITWIPVGITWRQPIIAILICHLGLIVCTFVSGRLCDSNGAKQCKR